MKTTIEHADDEELFEKCAAILQRVGWLVVKAENLEMETPKAVALRFNLAPTTFHKRLRAFPGQFPARTGPSGRIRRLHVTPELEDWLGRGLRGRKSTDGQGLARTDTDGYGPFSQPMLRVWARRKGKGERA